MNGSNFKNSFLTNYAKLCKLNTVAYIIIFTVTKAHMTLNSEKVHFSAELFEVKIHIISLLLLLSEKHNQADSCNQSCPKPNSQSSTGLIKLQFTKISMHFPHLFRRAVDILNKAFKSELLHKTSFAKSTLYEWLLIFYTVLIKH